MIFNKQKKGFTLIELLVVIMIISILATIGLYSYMRVRKQARDVKRREDIASIASALQMYYQDNGKYVKMFVGTEVFESIDKDNYAFESSNDPGNSAPLRDILSSSTNKYIDLPIATMSLYPYQYCSSDGYNYAIRAKLEIPKGEQDLTLVPFTDCSTPGYYKSGDYKDSFSPVSSYTSKSTGFE